MTTANTSTSGRMPTIFLAHGSPFLLDDNEWLGQLHHWASNLPRPRAVLMVSAHWEERPLTLGATTTVPLVYDFYGFPEKYYGVTYPAPGAPELAKRVKELLSPAQSVADAPARGLDHGAYVPMVAMYPEADVPTLQMSLPTMDAPALFEIGRALEPLRDEGVLIIGSGFLSHNLRLMQRGPNPATPSWASDFDQWAEDAFRRRDIDQVVDYREKAPAMSFALPTQEHFVPAVVALGAAADPDEPVAFPITGFLAGSLTKRSIQFG